MARPPKEIRKDVRLSVRFETAEAEMIARAADRAGITVSDLFRQAILRDRAPAPVPSRRRRAPVQDGPELARLLGAVGRIGGNVNQLARTANGGSWPETPLITEAAEDIRWMRSALVRALGLRETDASPPAP